MGGLFDNFGIGAAWIFTQNNGMWAQQGSKLVGSDNVGKSEQGTVSINSDGKTLAVGGFGDNTATGAVWIFNR